MAFCMATTNEEGKPFALLTPHPHACIDAKPMNSIRCLPCTPRHCRELLSARVTCTRLQCGAVPDSFVASAQNTGLR